MAEKADAEIHSIDGRVRVSHRVMIPLEEFEQASIGGPAMLTIHLGRLVVSVQRETAGLPVTAKRIFLGYEEVVGGDG